MWPKLKRDHIGLMVKTIVPMRNGMINIPTGTICKVEYARGGLSLETQPCEKCGVSVFIRKVSYAHVALLYQPKEEIE